MSNNENDFDNSREFARCICNKKVSVDKVIVGFPGIGLVGAIAAQHICEQLKLETAGFVEGVAIPPVAVFLDGILRYPYRIMAKEGVDFAVFIGESVVSEGAAHYISKAIMEWAEKNGAKEIICLDGFTMLQAKEDIVHLVAEPELKDKMSKYDIPPLKSGFIRGFSGAMLNKTMLNDIDGLALLVGSRKELPDPGGAAKLVNAVSKLTGVKIDAEQLVKQGESIKKKLQQLAAEQAGKGQGLPPKSKKRTFYT